ncbi:MAG: hypothetical protein LC679_04485 [Intrasporangiaceae bacterium]|nr:hypothetical protein [Intrasporangiaceae bacterium]
MPPTLRRRIVTARLLRTADLLDLHLTAVGGELHRSSRGPVLRVGRDGGHLVVELSFQHLGEQAYFLEPENPTAESPEKQGDKHPPSGIARHRASRPSRLVYELPEGTELGWTGPGLLKALPRLRLRVVPLATPGPDAYAEDESPETGPADFVLPPWVLESVDLGLITGPRTIARAVSGVSRARLVRGMSRGLSGRVADSLVVAGAGAAGGLRPGAGGSVPPGGWGSVRPRRERPRAPRADETALEVPYRLVVSPSAEHGAFLFDPKPVGPEGDLSRVQLWHARFTTRVEDEEQQFVGHDDAGVQRVVRAVWARDMEPADRNDDTDVTEMSTGPGDRRAIVRHSAATHEGITPVPLRVRRLDLSAIGASVDWRGAWDTDLYQGSWDLGATLSVSSYRHVTAAGRDTYVRIAYPGFLYPFGHRAELVEITERRIHEGTRTAYLRKRHFIVLRERTRAWVERDTPLVQVTLEPAVTPDLDRVDKLHATVPTRAGVAFRWDLLGVDRAGEPVTLTTPLLFVPNDAISDMRTPPQNMTPVKIAEAIANAYAVHGTESVAAHGQPVSFAAPLDHGDTRLETTTLVWGGHLDAENYTSRPYLVSATAVVTSLRHLAGQAPAVSVEYAAAYLAADPAGDGAQGFGPANPGGLFLRLMGDPVSVDFSTGTDRAGGFVSPNLAVRALSRPLGAVGDDGAAGSGLAAGRFDPAVFLDGALPKLFGLFSLVDLITAVAGPKGMESAPAFVTDALDTVSAIHAEAQRLHAAVEGARDRLDADIAAAAHQGADQAITEARDQLDAAAGPVLPLLQAVVEAIQGLLTGVGTVTEAKDAVGALVGQLSGLRDALQHPRMPVAARSALSRPRDALDALLAVQDVLDAVEQFAQGVLRPADGVTARYEWRPPIGEWPAGAANPVFTVNEGGGFALAVEVRASAQGAPSSDVSAELRNFSLSLLPQEPLLAMTFSRIGFRAGSSGKPEVDVVFDGMEFLGALGFIETLRRMIPFDGFADPPYVDVAPDGVTAGFDLELPNVAVGVFSLENIALGADARVPFLGDAVTVGFAFCSKDSPFRLTVMCIGGGGWVAVRLSPMGLVELEMGLEAAASLSIDLGVASGSVSISVGVYLRLEGDTGSLTGYFRIRGQVDVIGLISASITLELSLTYEFATGKMVGRASVVVEIEILFFSASVEVSCERRLAGSKGDPVLRDVMPPDVSGHNDDWSTYCAAFAPGA